MKVRIIPDPGLAALVRRWDKAVEDGTITDEDARTKPFEAGLVLAAATVLDALDNGDLAAAIKDLEDTLREIVHTDDLTEGWAINVDS